jgi:hypothetical protein
MARRPVDRRAESIAETIRERGYNTGVDRVRDCFGRTDSAGYQSPDPTFGRSDPQPVRPSGAPQGSIYFISEGGIITRFVVY